MNPLTETPNNQSKNIFQCYADCWKKYFKVSGRASRYEYWSFILVNFFINLVLILPFLSLFSTLYSLATIIPSITVSVRRLHDINKSGWLLVAPAGILLSAFLVFGIIGGIIEYSSGLSSITSTLEMFVAIIGGLIAFGTYLYWDLKKGDTTENNYGTPTAEEATTPRKTIIAALTLTCIVPILGVLAVGVISGYSQANNKFKMTKTGDQILMLTNNIRTAYATTDGYNGLNNTIATSLNIVPLDMIEPNTKHITNIYGGEVKISGNNSSFEITFASLPTNVCSALKLVYEKRPQIISTQCTQCNQSTCTFELQAN